jgi:cytochrome c6
MTKIKNFLIFFLFLFNFFKIELCWCVNIETGKKLFNENCIACHNKGTNVIIPEKNLQKEILERNGMYNMDSIMYQVLNGKNGMPAFGGRLKENEIEEIANYVILAAQKNFDF